MTRLQEVTFIGLSLNSALMGAQLPQERAERIKSHIKHIQLDWGVSVLQCQGLSGRQRPHCWSYWVSFISDQFNSGSICKGPKVRQTLMPPSDKGVHSSSKNLVLLLLPNVSRV